MTDGTASWHDTRTRGHPRDKPSHPRHEIGSGRGLCTSYDGYNAPHGQPKGKGRIVSVASITEISATSTESFEEATLEALARAEQTLRGLEGAWVKDMNVLIDNGNITGYKVNLLVTFVLEDPQSQ